MTSLATEVLDAVRAAGGEVKLIGKDRLKVLAPTPLPDELVQRLRASKAELLEALAVTAESPASIGLTASLGGDEARARESDDDLKTGWEERAAIIEYDGGAPRAWAEALARLDPARPPVGDCGMAEAIWRLRSISPEDPILAALERLDSALGGLERVAGQFVK